LTVFLHGGGYNADLVVRMLRPVMDKYGLILLAPTAVNSWMEMNDPTDRDNVDAAMKQVLRKFAIDPDKIALIGRCGGGPPAIAWGSHNLDVFSRIVLISATPFREDQAADIMPSNKKTEFLAVAGLMEVLDWKIVPELRRRGYTVKHMVGLRGHEDQVEDYDFVGRWLRESWTTPNPAARTASIDVANPVPVLTDDAYTKLITFWTHFMKEPDSIRTIARRTHLREASVPFGKERPSVMMVNIAALAAQYPSVAADLKRAGLTAQQHDAYRIALISAELAKLLLDSKLLPEPIEATSLLGRNLAFVVAHDREIGYPHGGMWSNP
jgi:predicted esterase